MARIDRRTVPKEKKKKGFNDSNSHYGVVTHLETDILHSEVKWDVGSITSDKVPESDGIHAELFQILKEDVVKVLHSVCQQIWKAL